MPIRLCFSNIKIRNFFEYTHITPSRHSAIGKPHPRAVARGGWEGGREAARTTHADESRHHQDFQRAPQPPPDHLGLDEGRFRQCEGW